MHSVREMRQTPDMQINLRQWRVKCNINVALRQTIIILYFFTSTRGMGAHFTDARRLFHSALAVFHTRRYRVFHSLPLNVFGHKFGDVRHDLRGTVLVQNFVAGARIYGHLHVVQARGVVFVVQLYNAL